jgi:membrane protease YdiL (CAAX protease family)
MAYALIWALFLAVPASRAVVIAQFRHLRTGLRGVLWAGVLGGSLLVAIDAVLLWRAGFYRVASPGPYAASAVAANLAWVTVVATTEEMIVRGLLLTRLRQIMPTLHAVGLTAIVFSVMHVGRSDLSIATLAQYFVDGLLFGWLAVRNGHIWGAVGVHLGKNLLVSLLFGGSRRLLPPLLAPASAVSAASMSIALIDLLAYAIAVPLCIYLVAGRTREVC